MKPMTALLCCALLAAACGSSSDESKSPGPTPGSVSFVSDATPSGAAVSLRAKEVTDGKLVLEIVGHDLSRLYGVATRVSVDPAALGFEKMEAGPVWQGAGDAIVQAKEGAPGKLVLVLTRNGKQPGVEAQDAVLATLHYKRLNQDLETPVTFAPVRSAIFGDDGRRIDGAIFISGQLKRN